MNRLVLVPVLVAAAAVAHAETYDDNARVVGVQPQYEQVRVPHQECSRQWVNEPRSVGRRDYAGAAVGGVAGALIGNQVGRGHGREAATAVGAVIGALTGDNLVNRDRIEHGEYVPREVTTCRNVDEVQSRLVGYQVRYEYRGQQFATFMAEQPGRYLPVRVSVEPVGR